MQIKSLPGVGIFGANAISKYISDKLFELGYQIVGLWTYNNIRYVHDDIKIFGSMDDLLVHTDVRLILTVLPPYLEAKVCVKAISIGKHVLYFPPIALHLTDYTKIFELSRYYSALISSAIYPLRFLPEFIYIKDLLNKNVIGSITEIDINIHKSEFDFINELNKANLSWMSDKWMGGGYLNTTIVHYLNLAQYFLAHNGDDYISHLHVEPILIHNKNLKSDFNFQFVKQTFYFEMLSKLERKIRIQAKFNVHAENEFQYTQIYGESGTLRYDGQKVTYLPNTNTAKTNGFILDDASILFSKSACNNSLEKDVGQFNHITNGNIQHSPTHHKLSKRHTNLDLIFPFDFTHGLDLLLESLTKEFLTNLSDKATAQNSPNKDFFHIVSPFDENSIRLKQVLDIVSESHPLTTLYRGIYNNDYHSTGWIKLEQIEPFINTKNDSFPNKNKYMKDIDNNETQVYATANLNGINHAKISYDSMLSNNHFPIEVPNFSVFQC